MVFTFRTGEPVSGRSVRANFQLLQGLTGDGIQVRSRLAVRSKGHKKRAVLQKSKTLQAGSMDPMHLTIV